MGTQWGWPRLVRLSRLDQYGCSACCAAHDRAAGVKSTALPCPEGGPSRQNLRMWPARLALAPAVPRPAVRRVGPEARLEEGRLSSTHPIVGVDDPPATSAQQE